MAISFTELYNARPELRGGGPLSPPVLQSKLEGAYGGALSDYERLMGSGVSVPRASSPATLRSTRATIARPSSSGAKKFPIGMPKPGITTTPTPGTPPTLTLPAYDTGKVEGLAQRFAAPGIRNLRSAVQDVQQGVYDNPNVKRMTVRDALQGYGSGLENVMAGALKTGAGIYGQEYGAEVNKAGLEFSAGQNRYLQSERIGAEKEMQSARLSSNERIAQLQNEWREYLNSLG